MPFIPTTTLAQSGAWASYTPVWSSDATQPVLNNGTVTGRYCQIGKLVVAYAKVTMGNTTTFGSGNYLISLPVAASSEAVGFGGNLGVLFDSSAGVNGTCLAWVNTDLSNMIAFSTKNIDANAVWNLVSSTTPWTWAESDVLRMSITYEAT